MTVHPDFADLVAALNRNHVRFMIVGAFALARLGYPRATGDLDIWIFPEAGNARSILTALSEFGFGEATIQEQDFLSGKVIQLGYPPVRIDMMSTLDGLETEEIWASREAGKFGDQSVFYLGREAFIKNKLAAGRHKDLADLEALGVSVPKVEKTE